VEAEGEQRPRDHLILFDDRFISCILEDLLVLPV